MKIEQLSYKVVIDSREKVFTHITNKFDEGFEVKPSHHDRFAGKKSTFTKPIPYYKFEGKKVKGKNGDFTDDRGLKVGDFTMVVKKKDGSQINFKDIVVIERKQNLSEICGNIYDSKTIDESGMNRFERELLRAFNNKTKLILLIEESDGYSKAMNGNFRHDKASKVAPSNFFSRLSALQARYNFEVVYLDKRFSAFFIWNRLYYEAREYLKEID